MRVVIAAWVDAHIDIGVERTIAIVALLIVLGLLYYRVIKV